MFRVQHVLGMGTQTDDFNCWGATMFLADPTVPTLDWVNYGDMHKWVTTNLTPIKRHQVREGDILALFSGDKDHLRLVHTAYALGGNQYVHKMGRNVARLETFNKVLGEYERQTSGYIFLRSNQCV